MERRKVLKIAAGAVAAGGSGLVAMTTAFKPEVKAAEKPKNIEFKANESDWKYVPLEPATTAEIAYAEYPNGSCMYGVFKSVVSQLAAIVGEPFASFPSQMMKYGHGGVNGYGTICGALNGAAAAVSLLVGDKKNCDVLMAELFAAYETTPLPEFKPKDPGMDFEPPKSVAKSVLCHASTTRWGKKAGYTISSKERKERCRRLTADIAFKVVTILNNYHANTFMANAHDNETARTCMTCHGSEGKLGNTSGKMTCTSCHEESLAHKVFADSHHKFMSKR
ncbi:C-GCAxxG-C-C family (seleno)protein [uncultured Draconibacterium sp.]|uniref:C-GCAxxG-C-C family (seleno)protein n=1 Tax=uncultured Draconibacterium sp. TaxID=1573823 RepID=UPI003261CA1E